MTIYLLVAFLLSLVCGVVFTPLILDFCKRTRLYDIPNERKVHKNATPRMGGISFFPSMLIAFTAILMFVPITDKYNLSVNIWSAVFFIGLLVIYLTGIVDDLVGLKAPTKFIVQIATGCLLPFCGLYINNLYGLPVPVMGGVAVYAGILAGCLAMFFLVSRASISWSIMAMTTMLLLGVWDDIKNLPAILRLIVQFGIVGAYIWFTGHYIGSFFGFLGIHEISYWIGIPLSLVAGVGTINAINLIDGIDGLAAGLSIIALMGFLAYFMQYHVFVHTYSILAAGMIGALIAFLYFNLFGKPERNTKIFMGDSWSLSLGFILGFLFIKCASENTTIWPTRPEALLVPLTLVFVPVADVIRVTCYRLLHHRPLFDADKNHIHHKLMKAGMSQHLTLVIILGLSLVYCMLNYGLYTFLSSTWIFIIDILLYCFVNLCINLKIKAEE